MKDKVTMVGIVVKIGNSQGIRITRKQLDQIGVNVGDSVKVELLGKRYDYTRALKALEELSKMDNNPFHDIKDPVAWQREIRKDRPLPGRE